MNVNDLSVLLEAEGCSESNYCIGDCRTRSDVFCLAFQEGKWRVYYTERGTAHEPILTTSSEDEACEYFYQFISSMRHLHCVGFFKSQAKADALSSLLEQAGVEIVRDIVPYGGPVDPRFRVFVQGKAIFRARELLGAIPKRDS